jgi:uncharacterized protein YjiS (DUF1127 family)
METIMRDFPRAILPRNAGSAPPARIGRVLQGWWLAYMEWRLKRLATGLLHRMSDRELKDLGLTRSQIELAARGRAGRHTLLSTRLS